MTASIWPEMKDNLASEVAKDFAEKATKEELAEKFIQIIESDSCNFEAISDILYICKHIVKVSKND